MGSISFLLPDPLPEAARETLPTATFAVPGSTGEYEQDPMPASVAETTRHFTRALHGAPSSETDSLAARVLEQSFGHADVLVREFVGQMFDTRHQEEGLLDARLAARMTGGPGELAAEYARTFNAAQVAFRWRDLEPEEARYDWTEPDKAVAAAKTAELPITGGPVIDLAPGMLPAWAAGWEGD